MATTTSKSFATPDEVRTPPHTRVEVVDLSGAKVARMTLQPGWRWSESIKPVAGTETCQVHHLGVLIAGTIHVVGADGIETDIGPGDAYEIQPGHDAWVVGETPVVGFEFDQPAAATFAKPTT
jgi:hypothetical protein